jgi:hypothetical protein
MPSIAPTLGGVLQISQPLQGFLGLVDSTALADHPHSRQQLRGIR